MLVGRLAAQGERPANKDREAGQRGQPERAAREGREGRLQRTGGEANMSSSVSLSPHAPRPALAFSSSNLSLAF